MHKRVGARQAALLLALSLAACQQPAAWPGATADLPAAGAEARGDAGQPFAEAARMTVPAEALEALAQRPNLGAMDAAVGGLLAKEAKKGQRTYRLQAPALSWTQALGGACSNTPGFLKPDVGRPGPGPYSDEYVLVVRDDGTVTKRNASTGAVVATRALGGTYTRTGVQVSGDNRLAYVVNTAGTLTILRTSDLNVQWSGQVSYTGFAGCAPFIDYANGGGFPLGTQEYLTLASSDGSIIRILVNNPPASVNPNANVTVSGVCYAASGGTNASGGMLAAWSNRHTIPYTGAQTVQTGCVSWAGEVWYGTQAGVIHKLTTTLTNFAAAPTLASWNIAPYTVATGNGLAVGAPPAVDFGSNNLINAAFFSVADRGVWIDPTSSTPRVSPPLVADKIPAAALRQGWLSNFPYTTAQTTYSSIDWASVSSATAPAPTRWGSGGATVFANSTGTVCWTLKSKSTDRRILGARYTSPGQIREFLANETVVGTYNTTANLPFEMGETPGVGTYYVTHNGSRNVSRFNADGTLRTPSSVTIPAGNSMAYWPMGTPNGDMWVTGQSGKIYRYNSAGALVQTIARANCYGIETDTANNAYVVCQAGGVNVYKYNATGVQQWSQSTGSTPITAAINAAGTELWVSSNNRLTRLNANTGAIIGNYAMPSSAYGLELDNDGNVWVCFTGNDTVQKVNGSTGAIIVSYTITGSGNPWEVDFDSNGDAWVGCDNGLYKLSDLGNLSDIFATADRSATADGINAYGLTRFRIPTGTYAGQPPVRAQLRMTAASTPISAPAGVENLTVNAVSPFVGGTPNTNWIGYNTPASINIDWNTRPTIGDLLDTKTNQAVVKDASVSFEASLGNALPLDKVNTPDAAGGVYCYGLQAQNKVLRQAAHWYSNLTAPVAASRPTLVVDRLTTPLNTNNGLRCQPGVDSTTGRVYFASCNLVFELPYTSATAWQDPRQIAYNYTTAGTLNFGPILGGTFFHNRTSVALNGQGQLIVADQDGTTNLAYLNRLNVPFYPTVTTNHLAAVQNLAPGTGVACPQLLWDYPNGSAYLTTGSNHAVKATIWQ